MIDFAISFGCTNDVARPFEIACLDMRASVAFSSVSASDEAVRISDDEGDPGTVNPDLTIVSVVMPMRI